jgi:hypothetical protein
MKMGAEPKKVAVFVGLIAVAGLVYWMNSSSDAQAPSVARAPVDPAAAVIAPVSGVAKKEDRRAATGVDSLGDFVYTLPTKVDPTKVDPTLRLDLLAKVQAVQPEGGVRFIFQIGQPPPDPVLEAAKGLIPKVDPLHPNGPNSAPVTTPASTPKPPDPPKLPTTPPINLKYYGYSTKNSDGEKKAFFLDGDDIIVAAEGDIIKKQYRVVRIGPTNVQMEDTASKSTQTLPLQPEAAPV